MGQQQGLAEEAPRRRSQNTMGQLLGMLGQYALSKKQMEQNQQLYGQQQQRGFMPGEIDVDPNQFSLAMGPKPTSYNLSYMPNSQG